MYDWCHDIGKMLDAYLDGELDVRESLRVESHLQECLDCRETFLAEKEFHNLVHTTELVAPAPEFAHRCIQAALSREARLRKARPYRRLMSPPWVAASFALASTVAVMLFVFLKVSGEQPPGLVKWAVAEHRQAIQDPSRLQITSSDPQVVSRWLYEQGFNVALPPLKMGHIRLLGARAASQNSDRAAYVAYQIGNERVSLLATTPKEIRLTDRAVAFQNILFHPSTVDGSYTLQWSDSQHTYVLVAKAQHAAHQACAVCHGEVRSREMEDGFRGI